MALVTTESVEVDRFEWLEDHYPYIAGAGDDSTWLICSCGWDETVSKRDWVEHLLALRPENVDNGNDTP